MTFHLPIAHVFILYYCCICVLSRRPLGMYFIMGFLWATVVHGKWFGESFKVFTVLVALPVYCSDQCVILTLRLWNIKKGKLNYDRTSCIPYHDVTHVTKYSL